LTLPTTAGKLFISITLLSASRPTDSLAVSITWTANAAWSRTYRYLPVTVRAMAAGKLPRKLVMTLRAGSGKGLASEGDGSGLVAPFRFTEPMIRAVAVSPTHTLPFSPPEA
jgi:hypothetical protein